MAKINLILMIIMNNSGWIYLILVIEIIIRCNNFKVT